MYHPRPETTVDDCMRENNSTLNVSNVAVRCTTGTGCVLVLGRDVCLSVPEIITGARMSDKNANPFANNDRRNLQGTAIRTREVDMTLSDIFWVRCGNAVSYTFGVNATDAARKVANARRRLAASRPKGRMPNVYLFLLDSVSHADFHRSFQGFARVLRRLHHRQDTKVYQMFRHTTVSSPRPAPAD